ncbi:MAG: ATP-binding protein [Phycisphaerales bacterium]
MSPYPTTLDAVTVILIDDDRDQLDLMTMLIGGLHIGGRPVVVQPFQDAGRAFAHLPRGQQEVVIVCDYEMPGGDGLEWLPDLVSCGAGPVLLMTSCGDERVASEAFRRGAADYLIKQEITRTPEVLARAMGESLRRWKLESYSRELARSLRTSNDELASRNVQLRRLTENAHRFVDDVAHEFRTPLAVIREFTSLVRDGIGGQLTEKQSEFLDYVLDSTGDLARLVDDFLDSSRMRAGTLPIDRRGVAVSDLVDRVQHVLSARSAARQTKIVVDVAPDLPMVHVDAEKFIRILVNFGVNAIKYAPAASTVHLRAHEAVDGIRFSVTDEGPGLSETERERLFERFARRDDHGTIEGVGLGLSIAAEMARLNLSTLAIESEPGAGSTFSVTAPLDEPESIISSWLATPAREAIERESAEPFIGIVRVGASSATGGDNSDGCIAEVINRLGHPDQLVLQTSDAGVLLLGRNLDPRDTADRLADAWGEHAQWRHHNDGLILPALSILPIARHPLNAPTLMRVALSLLQVPTATATAFVSEQPVEVAVIPRPMSGQLRARFQTPEPELRLG